LSASQSNTAPNLDAFSLSLATTPSKRSKNPLINSSVAPRSGFSLKKEIAAKTPMITDIMVIMFGVILVLLARRTPTGSYTFLTAFFLMLSSFLKSC
jgi:hypothetical protein